MAYIPNEMAFSGIRADLLPPAISAYESQQVEHTKDAIYGATVYPPVVLEWIAISMNVGIGESESIIPIITPASASCWTVSDWIASVIRNKHPKLAEEGC